jgi:hypothetical protein
MKFVERNMGQSAWIGNDAGLCVLVTVVRRSGSIVPVVRIRLKDSEWAIGPFHSIDDAKTAVSRGLKRFLISEGAPSDVAFSLSKNVQYYFTDKVLAGGSGMFLSQAVAAIEKNADLRAKLDGLQGKKKVQKQEAPKPAPKLKGTAKEGNGVEMPVMARQVVPAIVGPSTILEKHRKNREKRYRIVEIVITKGDGLKSADVFEDQAETPGEGALLRYALNI